MHGSKLLGFLVVLAAVASAPVAAQMQALQSSATGLIVGFRDADPAAPGVRSNDSGTPVREQAQARWERTARQGRERSARLAREAGLDMRSAGEAGNAHLLRFAQPLRGAALDDAVRRLRLHPEVAWVEPNVRLQRLDTSPTSPVWPNDLRFVEQWHLQSPDNGNRSALQLPLAWELTTGSPVVVAVVDSGVRFDHPDLAHRLLPGYDLVSELPMANDGNGRDPDASDPGDWVSDADVQSQLFKYCDVSHSSWHGTFIAGQIGAATNNAVGVAGLNWGARVLPVRVAGKCGALLSDLLDGLRWAAGLPVANLPANPHPARVINLSFGGDVACSHSPALQSTIDAVTAAGALLVVAAGNASAALTRPADCQRVMAVAAVRADGAKTDYSSFGSGVALAAPGGSVDQNHNTLLLSTSNAGQTGPGEHIYRHKQGTSFAAPQAAGVASLMLALNPALNPRQLINRMQAGARPHVSLAGLPACGTPIVVACNCSTSTCGAGLLDAAISVKLATGPAIVITALGQLEPGIVTLDGSQSVAIPGSSIEQWLWEQLEGPAVVLTAANAAITQATLLAEGSYVFRLTARDSRDRAGTDTVQVTVIMPPAVAGGGGDAGPLWNLSLWAWVIALAVWQRRHPHRPDRARLQGPIAAGARDAQQ